MADGPATLSGTLALVSLTVDDAGASVAAAVAATNSLVRGWLPPAPDGEWPAHHRYGANLLAARLWRRKDSPGGMLQFGMEAAVYVSGNWPDVALMLGLGEYRIPRVG
jgi:hypothetical protein